MDEILAQQPDAILIYAGHNEYYGALGVASNESLGDNAWLVNLYLDLQDVRLFRLVRDVVLGVGSGLAALFNDSTEQLPSATLMERMVAEQQIVFGSDIYQAGKKQFETNLAELLTRAKQHNVPVIISTLVSNVRKQKPFVSLAAEGYPAADSVYYSAQKYEAEGDSVLAKQYYYQAKDLDALRFRATEEFNTIIVNLAGKYQIPVVQLKEIFDRKSEKGITGNEFIIEHLHPNADGYFLMADAFLATMRENRFIADSWPAEKGLTDRLFYKKYGVTAIDRAYGDLRIYVLKGGWPFKPRSVPNTALTDYVSANLIDSLAVRIWQDDQYSLENAHYDLANYYLANRKWDLAYDEYLALICLTPYNVSPYIGAARVLIEANRYPRALTILQKSLGIKKTTYAYKWIGQILLNDRKVEESIGYLTEALRFSSEDPQILFNLSGAYMLKKQYNRAWELVNQLYTQNPDFPGAAGLRNQIGRLLKR